LEGCLLVPDNLLQRNRSHLTKVRKIVLLLQFREPGRQLSKAPCLLFLEVFFSSEMKGVIPNYPTTPERTSQNLGLRRRRIKAVFERCAHSYILTGELVLSRSKPMFIPTIKPMGSMKGDWVGYPEFLKRRRLLLAQQNDRKEGCPLNGTDRPILQQELSPRHLLLIVVADLI
jgi:hypothetical protein